ncbi:MAG: ABC transporter substrate-binding protein [Chloroflexi bacterium]|nr:ABC transporter substrate-binding protein [Chloroflexota bacterium]
MDKKSVWLVVSCIMALFLVVAACGPAAVEEKKQAPVAEEGKTTPAVVEEKKQEVVEKEAAAVKADTVKVMLTKMDGAKMEKMVEKPKYGGTMTWLVSDTTAGWDQPTNRSPGWQSPMQYSVLLDGDPARGPAGTGETDWNRSNFMGYIGLMKGQLAESWTIPDDTTIIFKMRQEVHFALDQSNAASRLVGGREVTAKDVSYSIKRVWDSPAGYHSINQPSERLQGITALDKYTVEMKLLPNQHGIHLLQTAGRIAIVAHEVVEKYGDLKDWRNSVGSGPVMLKDYVPGSSMTFIRNPNYFEMDPWFPENRLPYVDGVRRLVIPDRSTQLAAFRTAKIDYMDSLTWEESGQFQKSYPQILQRKESGSHILLTGRMDKPELPWGPQEDPKALKVRRALNMAINKQAIVDNYYGGNAELFSAPWPDIPEYAGVFRPLNTYSQDVQELFQYKPEKAKQLLKEAGYPDGFKASVVMEATDVDFFSILKDDLAKVGVELVFDVKAPAVYSSIKADRSFSEMTRGWSGLSGMPWKFHELRVESSWTDSYFEHPVARTAFNETMKVLGKDDARLREIFASVNDVYLESAQHVWTPRPWVYNAWWPWVKRFEAGMETGVYRNSTDPQAFNNQVWIDTALKKQMGY